jgi:2,3-bisphosphoglycerate-dependent phosphoglycerate mutase
MGKLIVARHHESEWNKLGKWTGKTDVDLTEYGLEMSVKMGGLIKDQTIDQAFVSEQVRTLETLLCMENGICIDVPITRSAALNERDYGDYTGKNKWEMEEILGTEEFEKLRRGWNYPVPHGETLKMVYERAVPFFLNTILPLLRQGKNILLVAHGNSIRALTKYIEQISDEDVSKINMLFGAVVIYDLDQDGHMIKKEVREIKSQVNA